MEDTEDDAFVQELLDSLPEPEVEQLPSFWETPITIIPDLRDKGGAAAQHTTLADLRKPSVIAPLYTQYVEPGCTRLTTLDITKRITFNLVIIDIDTKKVGCTQDEVDALVAHLARTSLVPNIAYRSGTGIHLVYRILPMTDIALFTGKRYGFQSLVNTQILRHGNKKFETDTLKDWCRLFYCPRIIKQGEAGIYDLRKRKIVLYCEDPLDLTNEKIPCKFPERYAGIGRTSEPGSNVYNGADAHIERYIQMWRSQGDRHNALRDVAWYALKRYRPEDHRHIAAQLEHHAIHEGLSEWEITTLLSCLTE